MSSIVPELRGSETPRSVAAMSLTITRDLAWPVHHGTACRMLRVASVSGCRSPAIPENAYMRGYLGRAAIGAAGTATFLGERYTRIARRRGKAKAQVARSILVIIWHLLHDPQARFSDLGAGYHESKIDKNRKARNHIRQLEALGYTVTLTQAA
jgi:hypothetical protein